MILYKTLNNNFIWLGFGLVSYPFLDFLVLFPLGFNCFGHSFSTFYEQKFSLQPTTPSYEKKNQILFDSAMVFSYFLAVFAWFSHGLLPFFLPFSFSHWRPHFRYVFDMMPSCYNTCDLTTLQKNQRIQFYHIFQTFSNRFMLARFGFASQQLQTFQRTCPNMLRFRALMSTKTHCT